MRKIWAVVRREFLERVRSKWFLISTILGPVFMIGMAVIPGLLLTRGGQGGASIVMVNEGAGTLAERVRAQLDRSGRFRVTMLEGSLDHRDALVDSLTRAVQDEHIQGFLVLTQATLEAGIAEYRGRNVSSLRDMEVLERALRSTVTVERLSRRGIDPAIVQEAQGGIDVRTMRISRHGTGGSGEATFILGYALAVLMYVVTLAYGITVMRSVVQEKQDRIIEVLVSSLKPFQLMLGKVLGVGGVGLLQMIIWGAVGFLTAKYRVALLTRLGVPAGAVAGFQLPAMGIELLVVVAGYFLLGYLFYSALFAMVGAAVNNETEAGQAQQPVMMLLIVALFLSIGALGDPGGQIGKVGALIPFSAPIVMPVRMATGDVGTGELLLSLLIMTGSTLLVVWFAGRIYRIGILMYGKRPSLKELWRWSRQS